MRRTDRDALPIDQLLEREDDGVSNLVGGKVELARRELFQGSPGSEVIHQRLESNLGPCEYRLPTRDIRRTADGGTRARHRWRT